MTEHIPGAFIRARRRFRSEKPTEAEMKALRLALDCLMADLIQVYGPETAKSVWIGLVETKRGRPIKPPISEALIVEYDNAAATCAPKLLASLPRKIAAGASRSLGASIETVEKRLRRTLAFRKNPGDYFTLARLERYWGLPAAPEPKDRK